jgi:hypothetical protein
MLLGVIGGFKLVKGLLLAVDARTLRAISAGTFV